jgi:Zn-finger nucleic acid-binding protein
VDCPKCDVTMERVRAAGVDVDRCPKCSGLWLDLFEKEALTKDRGGAREVDRGAEPADADSDRDLLCPRDGSTLITRKAFENRETVVDSCTVCGGVFLDAGELRSLHTTEPFGGDELEGWRKRLADVAGFFAS